MPTNYRPKNKKIAILAALGVTILFLSSNLIFMVEREETSFEKELFFPESQIDEEKMKEEEIKENLENMKGFFTKNEGQIENEEIYFTYAAQDKTFGFSESSCLIKLSKTEENITKTSNLKITFENSNKVIPVGVEELEHKSNFLLGNDSSKWRSGVSNYEKIIYENLYDGIDLVYYFNEKGLKYDWLVRPNGNPSQIVERFEKS